MGNIDNILMRVEKIQNSVDREKIDGPLPHQSRVGSSGVSAGSPVLLAETTQAAQASLLITVELLDSTGTKFGDSISATFIATDGATAANAALPRIATGKTVMVSKINGTWYVVNPTIIKSSVCA